MLNNKKYMLTHLSTISMDVNTFELILYMGYHRDIEAICPILFNNN